MSLNKASMQALDDRFMRECLAIDVGQSLNGEDVARVDKAISQERGLRRTLESGEDSESLSTGVNKWTGERGVTLGFGRSGKSTGNGNLERFNGRQRQAYLSASWFMSLDDAQCTIETWRRHDNKGRSHSA